MNEAARIASELTLKALSCLQDKVSGEGDEALDANQILSMLLNKDTRGMIAEAQNRAHGTPKQSVDHRSEDGTMTPDRSGAEMLANFLASKSG